MLILIFLCSFFLIMILAWTSSLYYLYLNWKLKEQNPGGESPHTGEKIHFSIIIPCYREERYILKKLENTAALDCPSDRMSVFVVDGASEDATGEIARKFCDGHGNFMFIDSPRRGKIPQVNIALEKITGGIVIITDVDGLLEEDALMQLERTYREPGIGCAGAYVMPAAPLPEDGLFWRHQNAMRLMESGLGHSSVMVAVAYSFRHDLFTAFPDDVIADDVYTAFAANTRGLLSLYCPAVRAVELRSGSNRQGMLRHKLRKLNANMRELKRFLPDWRAMEPVWRIMFLTKVLQSWLVAPALLLLGIFLVLSVATAGWWAFFFWGGALVVLLAFQNAAESVLKQYYREDDPVTADLRHRCVYAPLFLIILIGGLFRYFLVRQSSSYRKVN